MKCKVQLIGRLGSDADINTLPNGQVVATLSVVTEEYWKDKQGNPQKRATWHRVKFWNESTVGFIQRNIGKGQLVEIEGSFRYEDYDDSKGVHHKAALINGSNILPLHPLTKAHDNAATSDNGPDNDDQIPF